MPGESISELGAFIIIYKTAWRFQKIPWTSKIQVKILSTFGSPYLHEHKAPSNLQRQKTQRDLIAQTSHNKWVQSTFFCS